MLSFSVSRIVNWCYIGINSLKLTKIMILPDLTQLFPHASQLILFV